MLIRKGCYVSGDKDVEGYRQSWHSCHPLRFQVRAQNPSPQNSFEYWGDEKPFTREDLYFMIDDWDEFPSR